MGEETGPILRVACIQMRSGVDPARNLADVTRQITEAAKQGAKFIATPEMTIAVDQNPKRLFSNITYEEQATEIKEFSSLASQLDVWLLIGSMAVRIAPEQAANRSFLFSPNGDLVARYDKIHMFDVSLPDGETWSESKIYRPGDTAAIAQTKYAKIGLTICYDLRFSNLFRSMAQAGAEILCVPAAFTRQTGKAHWSTLLRARAIENGAFVVAPAQGGRHEDGRETYGHSLIIDPWGRVLAEAPGDEPGVILADLDLSRVQAARQAIPNLALESAFKVLNVTV